MLIFNCNDWFINKLNCLDYDDNVKSYIVSVFHENALTSKKDLSNKSISLLFLNAKNFETFQNIGDWVLFSGTFFHDQIKDNENLYKYLGQSSYDKCYKLLNYEWDLYKELSNELPNLIKNLQFCFNEN